MITTKPLSKGNWHDFVGRTPSDGCDGCWCYNHHIRPGDPDVRGELARRSMEALLPDGGINGFVAYLDDPPAGWCAVDTRSSIPGHDCVDDTEPDAWAIHCLYVPPARRNRGIAGTLVQSALEFIRSREGRFAETYARPPTLAKAAFAFLPLESLYLNLGFARIDSIDPNDSRLRLDLNQA